MTNQLSLFEVGSPFIGVNEADAEESFKVWSYSRREDMERCLHSYYCRNYGAKARTAKSEPNKERLRFLSKLKNRHLRTGDIAHLIIRAWLLRMRQGEKWTLDRVLSWARKIYRDDPESSRNYKSGDALPDAPNSPALLLEYYYGLENAESLIRESEQKLITALTTFITSPDLESFRVGGSAQDALVETNCVYKDEYFTARGKIDLAYREAGKIIIADWKIGNIGGGEDSLQLLAYARWAVQKFGCRASDVELYRVYLGDGKIDPCLISQKYQALGQSIATGRAECAGRQGAIAG